MLKDDYASDIDNKEILELNMKGKTYQYGFNGETKNIGKAIECYVESIKLGSIEAKEDLEMIYDDLVYEHDNEDEYNIAIKYAEEGLKLGFFSMNELLGRIYNNSEYEIYNKSKAISYFKEGMKNNMEFCCISLAIMYQDDGYEENAYECYCKFFELRDKEMELNKFFGAVYLRFIIIFQRDKIEFIEHLKSNIDDIIEYLSSSRLQIIDNEKQQVIHPEFFEYAKAVINGEINQDNHSLIDK